MNETETQRREERHASFIKHSDGELACGAVASRTDYYAGYDDACRRMQNIVVTLLHFAHKSNWRYGDNGLWHFKGDVSFQLAEEALKEIGIEVDND